jgi:hypothetical protein
VALRWTDPPAKESFQISNGSKKLKQEPRMARHCRNPMLRAERKRDDDDDDDNNNNNNNNNRANM